MPLFLFSLPLMAVGAYKLRGRKPRMSPDSDAVISEWTNESYCRSQDCMAYTQHNFVEWKDEHLVTKECTECEAVSEIWDLV